MLLTLHIRDFAIIETLELEFSPGMSALTGETGAGKSILLGALGLLLGDRADAASIRHGCERAEIGAAFDLTACAAARAWLAARDLDSGGECHLRRVISREGRSRAYINGTPTPVASLRELGEHLVDIHGQYEYQSLLRHDLQRRLLDRHGNHQPLLDTLKSLQRQWNEAGEAMRALIGHDQDRDTRLEFLRFQLQELEALAPEADESETLHSELARLSNAGRLIDTCRTHLQRLYEDDASAHDLLGKAVQELTELGEFDAAFREDGELFNGALIQLQEGIERLRDCEAQLELDPARLQWVEQRLDALHACARKHRIEVRQLAPFHARLLQDIEALEQADEKLAALERQRADLEARYLESARKLHAQRRKTAARIAAKVSESMQTLGMPGGRFEIRVSANERAGLSEHGNDSVEFLVSANPGQPLLPLGKVASGGELSRISLAIQVVAARATEIPTLIFDEVDSGVGGAVAETVSRQLQTLGRGQQILCVTHLAQVAAQAHNHLQVSKSRGDGNTQTRVRRLDTTQRVEEIARMLGGRKITESTRRHAQEMLLMAPADGTDDATATH